MKWPSIGSDDGETVDATPNNQGEERTTAIPNFVNRDNYTELQIEALEQIFSNYEIKQKEVADEINCSIGLVGSAISKLFDNNLDELFSADNRYHYMIDGKILKAKRPEYSRERIENILGVEFKDAAWGRMKSFAHKIDRSDYINEEMVDDEETQKENAYKYFKDNLDAGLDEVKESVDVSKLSTPQLRGLKANAVKHSDKHKESKNKTMTEYSDDTTEAAKMLVNKMDEIDNLKERVEDLSEAVEKQGETIDDLVEIYNESLREDDTDEKRYVGDNPTITLELTDFEAMFIAQRLWEVGEMYDSMDNTQMQEECKWWSRKLHGERNTRED